MQVYKRMPGSVRNVFASGYGYMMRARRYGPETRQLAKEALERESWSADRWQEYQAQQLTKLLDHAASNVPYYREHWRRRRARGDRSSHLELRNWPVLTKEELRQDAAQFLSDDRSGKLYEVTTSGSSGTPLTTWKSREAIANWYALVEARWRNWYDVDVNTRWAIFGGKVVTPFEQEEPPFWVWNRGLNQLYMSTFHLRPQNVRDYLQALETYEVRYLYGYASSLHTLASLALEQGLQVPQMKVAISNAEPLHDFQRESIGRAFGCPVRDTYGMAEEVAAASECEAGNMHLWPEVGVVEVLADHEDRVLPAGEDGRLVCTSWLNPDMPLIRYEVGDRGALAGRTPCSCGRSLPRIERIVGRISDNLVTRDGRRVFYIYPVFFGLAIREAQVIQEELDEVRVRLVRDADYSAKDEELIRQRLRERLGPVRIRIEAVDEIERGPNGKFQAVICRVEAPEVAPVGRAV